MPPSRTTGEAPILRVRFSVDASVARISLARPEKRNALSPETIRQLHAAVTAAARDDQVRVVVLGAEGPDFCAGADLDSLATLVEAGADVHRADARALADLYLAMRALPKPIIAAVHGHALGGGAGLVTACDIVVAATDAQLAYPEVRIGFIAAIVMAMLRGCVPEKSAFELVTTGRMIQAEEAARLGLVTRVVPPEDVNAEAVRIAREIAALPPESVAGTKKIFYEVQGLTLSEAFDRGVEANVSARTTAAFRSGLASFLSRRRQ